MIFMAWVLCRRLENTNNDKKRKCASVERPAEGAFSWLRVSLHTRRHARWTFVGAITFSSCTDPQTRVSPTLALPPISQTHKTPTPRLVSASALLRAP